MSHGSMVGRMGRVALVCILMCVGAAQVWAMPSVEEIREVLAPAAAPGYRMYAIRTGITPDAKRSTFITDATLPATVELAFSFWLLEGFDRVILIDTGFVSQAKRKQWRVQGYRDPENGLGAIGIKAQDVTDVIITHGHWDHVGGLVRFPQARIWISDRELKTVRASAQKSDPALHAVLEAAMKDGRVHVTESLQMVAPSVYVVPVGLHTQGFQMVVVANSDHTWVFASDMGPLRANFERRRPTGLASESKGAVRALDLILELVGGNLDWIVPGHEPRGFGTKGIIELR